MSVQFPPPGPPPPGAGQILALALALAVALAAGTAGTARGQQAELAGRSDPPGCPWVQPVDAPVVDPFRPPEHPYGPGNRGIEYGMEPGQAVRAVASGEVSFTGPVGGRGYVVVDHGGGLRSTYGPLSHSIVVRGQQVGEGDELGAAAAGFHLTARRGSRYVDPAPLLAGECPHARLVPRLLAAAAGYTGLPEAVVS